MFTRENQDKIKEFVKSLENNDNFLVIKDRFPHIAKNIVLFAGHEEFNDYMNNLMMDSRDGHREGFPKEVSSSIFKLSIYHDGFFSGCLIKKNANMYSDVMKKHSEKHAAWNEVSEVDRAVRTLNSTPSPKVAEIYDQMAIKAGLKKD